MVSESYFLWTDSAEVLQRLHSEHPLTLADKGRVFENAEAQVQFKPAPLCPIGEAVQTVDDYLEQLAQPLGPHLVILMQAGATSMGVWQDDDLVCHKVIKKYVTRGKGRAQTTYLKTKGKSRYGSRLRLQNARDHLDETNERLHQWWEEHGPFTRLFYSCPVRMWPELFNARVLPPFGRDFPCIKIGRDVRVPGHDELKKIRGFLRNGVVVRLEESS